MKRISKFISIILLIAILLPGAVEAVNINNGQADMLEEDTRITEGAEESVEELGENEVESIESDLEEVKPEIDLMREEERTEDERDEVNKDIPEKINLETSTTSAKYIERIKGNNRVETSIEVSKQTYKGKVDTVFLAGYDGQADALTASFAAGQKDGPLLLSNKSKLSDRLLDELERLSPKKIVILGGENAVNKNIENELINKKYTVERIKGSNRIETAIDLASKYATSKVTEAFVIEYDSLVDALAIGPVAARDGIPILIIKKDSVPSQVGDFLRKQKINKINIVGGENAVSPKAKAELEKIVGKVGRISGGNRVQTSISISKEYFSNRANTIVANGYKYTDALIGGYFAAKKNAPIILTNENAVTQAGLDCIGEGNVKAYVLGGETIISDNMFNAIIGKIDPTYVPKPPKPEPEPEPKPEPKPEPEPEPEPKPEPTPEPEPEPGPGQRKKYSTTTNLNMRAGIGVGHPILLTIPKGREVSFISKHGDWSKVKYDNKEGYVSNRYIKIEIVSQDEPVEKPEPPKPGKHMVFLDYGHGGSDPGAVYQGRREKDDTLFIGMLVAKELRRHGVIVDESRTTDKRVELWERPRMANKKNYDYFVSFHRNAFRPETALGVETFTFPTSSAKAKSLASEIQKNLVGVGFYNRGVKQANYQVLRETRAPAVLIEIGFIDNTIDNKIFDAKTKEMVNAISSAILTQLKK